jgi:hypothetical protein
VADVNKVGEQIKGQLDKQMNEIENKNKYEIIYKCYLLAYYS